NRGRMENCTRSMKAPPPAGVPRVSAGSTQLGSDGFAVHPHTADQHSLRVSRHTRFVAVQLCDNQVDGCCADDAALLVDVRAASRIAIPNYAGVADILRHAITKMLQPFQRVM